MATKDKEKAREGPNHERVGFWYLFGRAALSVVLGILLAIAVPSRFSEEMVSQTIARFAAPFSGYLFDYERKNDIAADPRGWNGTDITVLVIDREALEGCREGWPARYPFYTWLLGYLNRFPPKGLFIDVILSQSRSRGSGELEKTTCTGDLKQPARSDGNTHFTEFDGFKKALTRLTSSGTRVFLAARRTPENMLITNPELDNDVDLKALKRVGVEFSAHAVDRLAWTYPLVYPKESPCQEEHGSSADQTLDCDGKVPDISEGKCQLSAAFAIFEDIYEKRGGGIVVPCNSAKFMSVTWPLDTASDGLLWRVSKDEESEARRDSWIRVDQGDDDAQMYCTSSDSELTLLMRAEARAIFRPASRPLCVHYRTIHASMLQRKSVDERANGEETGLDDVLRSAFKDRVVMIGTAFAYSNDLILSPLQDRIPGVFLHAVALDNLLSHHSTFEDIEAWEPRLIMPMNRWCRLGLYTVIGILAMSLVVIGKSRARERFKRFHRERSHWKTRFSAPWWRAKQSTALFNLTFSLASGIALVVVGVGMILIGEWMQIPFLVVAHVIACTIAAEFFEWSEHLFRWITDIKEN
ncbi:CHASE2 domain-containing protein [Paraburkholderia dipogonis]|uniref:CHASE2 domain-containing protein n=2 Tax=Paraburkholderia dipogonis TaxID=1211383 RepID=A0A4Y8MXT4_9BURK|nr:CHASE2 domain-containing protein [Paraburkholderia dipogonis]